MLGVIMFLSVIGVNGQYYVTPVFAHGQLPSNKALAGPFESWNRAERAIPVLSVLNSRLK